MTAVGVLVQPGVSLMSSVRTSDHHSVAPHSTPTPHCSTTFNHRYTSATSFIPFTPVLSCALAGLYGFNPTSKDTTPVDSKADL